MKILLNVVVLISSFFFMEWLAWFSHKYLMHGVLWFLHRDHHQKNRNRFFEVNDYFFIIFATPGILLIYLGYVDGIESLKLWAGVGISLYGMAYVFVHDIAVHQRVRIFTRLNSPYFTAIRKAHKIHHKNLRKENNVNFGFIWIAKRYLDEAKAANRD